MSFFSGRLLDFFAAICAGRAQVWCLCREAESWDLRGGFCGLLFAGCGALLSVLHFFPVEATKSQSWQEKSSGRCDFLASVQMQARLTEYRQEITCPC